MKLTQRSIAETIRYLENYLKDIEQKTKRLAERLAEEGVQIAKLRIADLGAIDSGELLSKLEAKPGDVFVDGAVWYVYTGCPYAAYVEFGTGYVGAKNPYPGKIPVVYAQGETIHQIADGRIGWFYKGDDNKWHFTEGMRSRPFMYETTKELYLSVNKIAREVFG